MKLPAEATPHFVFSNHDDKRLISRYGAEHHRSIAMLMLTLLGAPIVYYGDEIGMSDAFIPQTKRLDLPGLLAPDQNPGRDPARTPMQWLPNPHAGFTSDAVEPWLPVNDNHLTVNVNTQEQDPYSTLCFYEQLLKLRKQSTALIAGSILFVQNTGDDILAYLRKSSDEVLLIIINFGGDIYKIDLTDIARQTYCLLSSDMQRPQVTSIAEVTLSAYESILIKLA